MLQICEAVDFINKIRATNHQVVFELVQLSAVIGCVACFKSVLQIWGADNFVVHNE